MIAKAASILVAGTLAGAWTTEAFAYEKCEPFTVVTTNDSHEMTYVDLNEEGPSVGDRRVFRAILQDKGGQVVGRTDGHTTVLYSDAEGNARVVVDLMLQFPTGVIFYKITPAVTEADLADATQLLFPSTASDRIIVGGSGVFAGAWGTVDVVRGDGASDLIINVSCP